MKNLHNVALLFDGKSKDWTSKYASALRYRLVAFERALKEHIQPASKVADLGCGTAPLLRHLHSLGYEMSGLDVSPEMVKVANEELSRDGIDVVVGNSPIEDASESLAEQDAVVCSSVLEYVDDLPSAMSSISRCLVPGGIAVVSLPNNSSPVRVVENILAKVPLANVLTIEAISKYSSYLKYSKNRPSSSDFGVIANSAGLKLIERRYMNEYGALSVFGERVASTMSLYILKKF